MLRKIAAAGGTRMTEALLERVDDQTRPRVRAPAGQPRPRADGSALVSQASLIAWITAGAVLMLVAAYGVGAPFLLLRTALTMSRRRRLRYRPRDDEVLATSRFTIPVSLVLPIAGVVPGAARPSAARCSSGTRRRSSSS